MGSEMCIRDRYTVVHTQGNIGFAPAALSIRPGLDEKFRYCLIQKTEVEAFCIGELNVYTNDIPWEKREVCRQVTISNNYITRVANYYYGGSGIVMYYCDGLTVEHNEVHKTPYSGISLGWGWSNQPNSTANTRVLNNLVDEYNMELHDGGGIYLLGRQQNSVVCGNYIKNERSPFGALYFDDGASSFTVSDNCLLYTSDAADD